MKKVFPLLFAWLTLGLFANAQTLLSEGFEGGELPEGWSLIDEDEDGANWAVKNNFRQHSGSYCISSTTYTEWLNPLSLTPNDWLITPAVTLPGNDTSSALSFWVAGEDEYYPEEYFDILISTTGAGLDDFTDTVYRGISGEDYEKITIALDSFAGHTVHIAFRHYFAGSYNSSLNLDDITVGVVSNDPSLSVTESLDFGTVDLTRPAVRTATVSGANLTGPVTAVTSAPFSVSSDSSVFGPSAEMPSAGGTLFVKFTPTAEGPSAGSVTLNADGAAEAVIGLAGTAIDCSGHITLPYAQDFEDDMPSCYTLSDAGGVPGAWSVMSSPTLAHSGSSYAYSSPDGDGNCDNYMILPAFTVDNHSCEISFYAAGTTDIHGHQSTEHFSVCISAGAGASLADFTEATEDSVTGQTYRRFNVPLGLYAGQSVSIAIRHHDLSGNAKGLSVDDIAIGEAEGAVLDLQNTAISFGVLPTNTEAVLVSSVTGHDLTTAITATTHAPFSVSNDGVSYAATTTLPAEGGTLHVKFTPTAAGTFSDSIILSAEGLKHYAIILSGSSVDCQPVTSFPFTEKFENGRPDCWLLIDKDGDGENWQPDDSIGNNNSKSMISISNYRPNVNNWLITPALVVTSPISLSFSTSSCLVPEEYGVYVSTHGSTNTADFVSILDTVTNFSFLGNEYTQTTLSLNDYAGDTVRFAFRHFCTDGGGLFISLDDIEVRAFDAPAIELSSEAVDFGSIEIGEPCTRTVEVHAFGMTDPITASVSGPFTISGNGNSFGATATLPAVGGTLHIAYVPTEEGTHTGTATLTGNGATATIQLIGNAFSCDPITEYPYTEGFENDGLMPPCWQTLDADGDHYNWDASLNYGVEGWAHSGQGMVSSESYYQFLGPLTPDNWLISPHFTINENATRLSFWAVGNHDTDFLEKYCVLVSTGDPEPAEFIPIYTDTTTNVWKKVTLSLSDYVGQDIFIAFRHFNCTDQYMLSLDDIRIDKDPNGIEGHAASSVNVYPNPAGSMLHVTAGDAMKDIAVCDMAGARVGFITCGGANGAQVDVSGLACGMYFLKVRTADGLFTRKVQVVR